jgi:hypothetical protein
VARLALLAVLVAAVAGVSLWQVGTGASRRDEQRAKPLPGLPAYTAGYRGWIKLNAKPIPPRRLGDAHLGTKNIYASKRKAGARYPLGTIIVKEASRPGKKFIGLIAVMRKIKGISPRNNDWQMIEYTRGSPTGRFSRIASGLICYSCHVGARAADYVCSQSKEDCP